MQTELWPRMPTALAPMFVVGAPNKPMKKVDWLLVTITSTALLLHELGPNDGGQLTLTTTPPTPFRKPFWVAESCPALFMATGVPALGLQGDPADPPDSSKISCAPAIAAASAAACACLRVTWILPTSIASPTKPIRMGTANAANNKICPLSLVRVLISFHPPTCPIDMFRSKQEWLPILIL